MLWWQKTILIFIAGLALFFLDKARFFDSAVSLVNRFAISPTTRFVFNTGGEGVFLFKNVFGVRELIRENLFLKNERDFFRGEYFNLLDLKQENEFLRRSLDLGGKVKKKIVLADILALDPFQAGDSLLISKGVKDGVKTDDVVVLSGNVLVGKIKEAGDKDSRVLLITSAQSRVTVVSEDGAAKGVVMGSASGALSLDLVLKEALLRSGQILLSSGLDGFFERGFLVGEVGRVLSDDSAPFQEAEVRPFFDLRDLKQVFVLLR